MNILVVCLHIIVCLVLIIVILLQAGRGQGLTGGSFGGNVQSLLGTKSSSFLTKATSVCAILFLFTCIGLNVLEVQKSRSLFKSPKSQAPLDIEQIKKTLEKMKLSEKTGAAAAARTAATTEKTNVEKATETAKANATKLAENLTKKAVTPVTETAKKQ
jgi:preprotein translocase subunit SecG